MYTHELTNTAFLQNDFTSVKTASISEIAGEDVRWLRLYPLTQNNGLLPVLNPGKQYFEITFEATAKEYVLKLFSSIQGMTFSGHETIIFHFESGVNYLHKFAYDPGKYSTKRNGYEASVTLLPANMRLFQRERLQKILIENRVISEPCVIGFNGKKSGQYATTGTGQEILMNMAEKIIGARLLLAKDAGVPVEW